MKQKNRLLPALTALLLLSVSVISCGESASPAENGSAPVGQNAETAPAETEDAGPKLELEPADYNGFTVRMVTLDAYNEHFKLDMEADGDVLNDAGHERNNAVAELLNVDFAVTEVADPTVDLRKSVMAGDDSYDFIFPHATVGIAALVTDGILYDWNELKKVDFSKPWWNQSMSESLGIGGHLYYASGDIVMAWQGMMAVLFNKSYLNGMDLEKDLYQTVFDGEWTLPYMTELIKGIAQDLDGDGKWTAKDKYGILDNKNTGYQYMYSSGLRVTMPDADGYPVLTLNTERMLKLVDQFYNYIYSGDVFLDEYSSVTYATSTYRDMLLEGRSFLTTLDVGGLYAYLREIEFDFGLLPMPKLDETQSEYPVFCGAGLIGVPSNLPDADRTGTIAEAMAYYSYKYIRPAFFDIVLENKAVRDENSYKVLQMMHEHKVFDFGFNFDATGSAYGMLGNVVISGKSTDFASHYQKNEKKILNGFEKIVTACKGRENQ